MTKGRTPKGWLSSLTSEEAAMAESPKTPQRPSLGSLPPERLLQVAENLLAAVDNFTGIAREMMNANPPTLMFVATDPEMGMLFVAACQELENVADFSLGRGRTKQ